MTSEQDDCTLCVKRTSHSKVVMKLDKGCAYRCVNCGALQWHNNCLAQVFKTNLVDSVSIDCNICHCSNRIKPKTERVGFLGGVFSALLYLVHLWLDLFVINNPVNPMCFINGARRVFMCLDRNGASVIGIGLAIYGLFWTQVAVAAGVTILAVMHSFYSGEYLPDVKMQYVKADIRTLMKSKGLWVSPHEMDNKLVFITNRLALFYFGWMMTAITVRMIYAVLKLLLRLIGVGASAAQTAARGSYIVTLAK